MSGDLFEGDHTVGALFRRVVALFQEQALSLPSLALPSLEARLLVQKACHLLPVDFLVDHATLAATSEAKISLLEGVHRRLSGEPISRILGEREFYGRSFCLSPAVLDPRPDSECLIEEVLRLSWGGSCASLRLLDMGTGSGALLITLLAEREEWTGTGVDVSTQALEIAQNNAILLGVESRSEWILSDWFSDVEGEYDGLVSNPPYLRTEDIAFLDRDVRDYDPHLALDGGEDGLSAYRILAHSSQKVLKKGGFCVVEIGSSQADEVSACFFQEGFIRHPQSQGIVCDLGGRDRVLSFQRIR